MAKIKEFIYIDQQAVNSILAQINQGLKTNTKTDTQDVTGEAQHTVAGQKNAYTGGISLGINAEASHDTQLDTVHIQHFQTASSTSLESEPNDYAIDQIIAQLTAMSQLNYTLNANEGAFIKVSSAFKLNEFSAEFDLLSQAAASVDTNPIPLETAVKMIKSLMADTVLICINSAIAIANCHNFRLNAAQRIMLHRRKTPITILGIIESKFTSDELAFSNSLLDSLDMRDLGDVSTRLTFALMQKLVVIKKGDRLIKPIAIYFG